MSTLMDNPNKQRLIHFLPDEKVTNNFISMLESVYPQESRYIVIGTSPAPRMTKLTENVEYFVKGSTQLAKSILNLSKYQKVFLHCINLGAGYEKIDHPNVNWIIWGGDLYEGFLCQKGYRIYVNEKEPFQVRAAHSPLGNIPVWLYKALVKTRDFRNYQKRYRIIKKLKAVTAIDEDYNLFKKYCPELRIDHAPFFSYYPIEKQIGEANLDKQCRGSNIWVGNSPALNGNHSSIFGLLKDFPPTTKVYCPMSYGEQRLIDYIDEVGRNILGQRFVPLKEFMPTEKYFEKYLDANAFIFGHLRQCAMGSIMMALYFGGKCFLYSDSPLYNFFKRNGAVIFSIEEDLSYESTQNPLSKDNRKINQEFVKSICSSEAIRVQIKVAFG